jgi:hypothetical protein
MAQVAPAPEKKHETLYEKSGSVAQVVQHLSGKCEALSANPVLQERDTQREASCSNSSPREFVSCPVHI